VAAGIPRRVAILQPNVDQYRKWDKNYAQEIRSNIGELVAAAAQEHPDLILWPESSMPDWLDAPENARWLRNLLKRGQSEQLIGALARADVRRQVASAATPPKQTLGLSDGPIEQYNSAVLFDPAGNEIGEYHKRRLVPFGEFVPWRAVTSKLIDLLNQMEDLDAGSPNQALLPTLLGRLGVTICYEAVFPSLSRSNAAAGADVLVNLTNDGWYKDTWAPYQHFYVNIFRSVENRRPVVRAANTGISGVIDPYGAVIARLDLGQRGTLAAAVPTGLFPGGSFYSRHGDWFGWISLIGTLAAFAAGFWRRLIA
jgi:apolipoprotein N-acyltransferase